MVSQTMPFSWFSLCSSQGRKVVMLDTQSKFARPMQTSLPRPWGPWKGQLSKSPSPPGSAMGSVRARRSSNAADRRGPSEPVMPGSRLPT
jgi:hypothetical protein